MTGPEYIIVAVIVAPLWLGGLVLWWVTMKQRRPATPASSAPAGWHADPTRRHELRYWDGQRWTAHITDSGVTAIDPLG